MVNYEEDVVGYKRSIAQITKIIEAEIDNGIPSDRIILGGFSQGCVVTYLTGLTYGKKLGGLILLSGRLPLQDKFKSVRSLFSGQPPPNLSRRRESGRCPNMRYHSPCSGPMVHRTRL